MAVITILVYWWTNFRATSHLDTPLKAWSHYATVSKSLRFRYQRFPRISQNSENFTEQILGITEITENSQNFGKFLGNVGNENVTISKRWHSVTRPLPISRLQCGWEADVVAGGDRTWDGRGNQRLVDFYTTANTIYFQGCNCCSYLTKSFNCGLKAFPPVKGSF